jgi:transcriptional regulator with XRE-family HTH domain
MPIYRHNLGRPTLTPNRLLDHLIEKKWGVNDKEIAKLIGLSTGTVSKIRNGRKASPEFILAVYDATDLGIDEIREMLK